MKVRIKTLERMNNTPILKLQKQIYKRMNEDILRLNFRHIETHAYASFTEKRNILHDVVLSEIYNANIINNDIEDYKYLINNTEFENISCYNWKIVESHVEEILED